ncbi:hypothetical protein HNQ96_000731 [Aminobacter lissarensis]|uniref:Uncharacterized protein n=1 Tax=Aminobacter carboxidus TaxID=376165 RepID=A0A8E1WBZ4_9HYPH|nr:hypothetical protein [Aminobacter lissarensis]
MRLPVSTRDQNGARRGMLLEIVGRGVVPSSREDRQPSASESPHGMRVLASTPASFSIDIGGPTGAVNGAVDGNAQPLVAGPSPTDAARSPALIGDRREVGLSDEVLAFEAGAHTARFRGDLGANGRILGEVTMARLPLARLDRPPTAAPQFSFEPSRGEHTSPSLRWRGTTAQSALKMIQRNHEVAG